MLEAPVPADEARRQQAVDALHLADTPPDPLLEALLRLIRAQFGTRMVLISLIDGERQWFKARVGMWASEGPRPATFCGHAVVHQGIFEVPDALLDPRFADNPNVTGEPHVRFYAGIPLYSHDGCAVGTLCLVDPQPRRLTPAQRDCLVDYARVAEGLFDAHRLRMEHSGLLDALGDAERRALIDPLTQLWNRTALRQMGETVLRLADREERLPGFIYLDLDHFKRINDTHGHAAGDQVLIEVAKRIASMIRPDDLPLRLGGEEFAVLALVHGIEELQAMAERIRQCLSATPIELSDGSLPVTASLGVALADSAATADLQRLLARADQALYQAKQQGRDRVVTA